MSLWGSTGDTRPLLRKPYFEFLNKVRLSLSLLLQAVLFPCLDYLSASNQSDYLSEQLDYLSTARPIGLSVCLYDWTNTKD